MELIAAYFAIGFFSRLLYAWLWSLFPFTTHGPYDWEDSDKFLYFILWPVWIVIAIFMIVIAGAVRVFDFIGRIIP